MSFVGSCIAQAVQITSQDGRLAAVESLAASKVAQAVYDLKVAALDSKDAAQDARLEAVESLAASKVAQAAYDTKLAAVDAKDAEQDGRLTALESDKVAQAAYDTKLAAVDAKDAAQDGRLTALESGKVALSAYNTKLAAVDAKDAEQDGRLSAVEGRATALESDIAGRVQAAIDDKVAQGVFDSLATELRDADSALTAALATKVSAVTQQAVDDLQTQAINTKASLAQLNNVIGAFNDEITRLDGVDATKVDWDSYNPMIEGLQGVDADHESRLVSAEGRLGAVESKADWCEGILNSNVLPNLSDLNGWRASASGTLDLHSTRVAAIEEFISALLATYVITKPNGVPYSYNGLVQNVFGA